VKFYKLEEKTSYNHSISPSQMVSSYMTVGGNDYCYVFAANSRGNPGWKTSYSSDKGATWSDLAYSGKCIYTYADSSADELWIYLARRYYDSSTPTTEIKVYRQDMRSANPMAQLGDTLSYPSDVNRFPVGLIRIDSGSVYLVVFDADADSLLMYLYNSGTSTWDLEDTYSSGTSLALTTRTLYHHAYSGALLTVVYDTTNDNIIIVPFSISSSTFGTAVPVNDLGGVGNKFRMDHHLPDTTNDAYGSLDNMIINNRNRLLLSGEVYDSGGSKVQDAVLMVIDYTQPVSDGSYWMLILDERIIPCYRYGAARDVDYTRFWGYQYSGSKIFVSFKNEQLYYIYKNSSLSGSGYTALADVGDSEFGLVVIAERDDYTVYTCQDKFASYISKAKVVREVGKYSKAQVTMNLAWDSERIIALFDDSDNLLFRGLQSGEEGYGVERAYSFLGIEKLYIEKKYTFSYTSATGVHTIARLLTNGSDYLYHTDASIPDPGITYKITAKDNSFKSIYDELADRIDGFWYVAPDGRVYLLKASAQVSSGVTKNQGSGDVTPPDYKLVNKTYNYIHLFGRGYLESDGDSKDTNSIYMYGKKELIRSYPGVNDATELQNLAASLLARDGVATPPLDVKFMLRGGGFVQEGESMNFQWTHVDRLSTAADYTIQRVAYTETGDAWIHLTNTIFQSAKDEEKSDVERKTNENEQQIRETRTEMVTWTQDRDANSKTLSNVKLSSAQLSNDLDANSHKVTNLAAPTNDDDAARKVDVDAKITNDFVTWRDQAPWDYSYTGGSGGWTTLSLSGIVASGAKVVILMVSQDSSGTCYFRKTGTTNYIARWSNMIQQILVPLDGSRQIDYNYSGGALDIQVVGWW